ncbi:MAG: cation transporter [Deltaproteobacteria bacterium]|nr:cation transporter [Deltaproteobacteria bacterium]
MSYGPAENTMNEDLKGKALLLEYVTVGYNILEGLISIIAGVLSGSIALIGFGFDSAIESASGAVLIWRLRVHGKISPDKEERIEKKAVKLVGYSFFVLGFYVLFVSVKKLYYFEIPEPSLTGIVIAILSIIIMPVLARMKFNLGKKAGLRSLVADSKQTYLCALLSVALLIGLSLNYFFSLWWADPVAALVIVVLIFKEGYYTLKEEELCCC